MNIFRKLITAVFFIWVLVILFSNCKGPKEISKTTAQVKEDTLTTKTTESAESTIATEANYPQTECLPQDKPFLDSLTSNLFYKNTGGIMRHFLKLIQYLLLLESFSQM